MANGWYENAIESFARKGIDWVTDPIKAYPVGPGYVPNLVTDTFVNAIGANLLGAGVLIDNRVVLDGGILDGDDLVFSDVPGGAALAAVVVAVDKGIATTSPLLLYFDTGANFPMTATGGPISVQWDTGANRIARL